MIDVSHVFSKRKIARLNPIVIGGCARSGTTLLLSVLSCHPDIYSVPFETQALCPTAYAPNPALKTALDVAAIERLLCSVKGGSRYRCWCEKTPKNVLFFGRILKSFGSNLRVLHLVRDGRDVVCSVHPDAPGSYWVSPRRWTEEVEAGLIFDGHPQVMTIRYEDLVMRYCETVRTILDFLSLEFVQQMNNYPANSSILSNNAWSDSARPISSDSVGRWRQESQRSRVEQLLAEPGARQLLSRLQYGPAGE